MNINDIKPKPCIFKNFKTVYAICDNKGYIIRIYTTKDSALYMLTQLEIDGIIYEVVCDNKGKIVSNLGEI